uniref:Uncharacterized protein n=1 Tax=Alexandrium catenella TaxID=2925 RepID=A0A7S1QUF6_ALECA
MPMEDAKKELTADAENPLGGVQARCTEAQDAGLVSEDPRWQRMDRLSKLAVNLATFTYLPLQVPQIVKNLQANDPTDLAGLAWQGTTTGALGNLMLCTYFASKREWAAVRVQAIGAITNFMVVTQIWHAGYCPTVPFFVFLAIICVGLVIPLLKAVRCLPARAFSVWTEATTAIGLGALLSLVGSTAVPNNDVVLGVTGLVGVAIMLVLLITRPPRLVPLMGRISGWLATYLFMFMPVPQVIDNFINHEKAKSFAIGFAVLAAIGNGLCTSRALFMKDSVWFTGAIWGTVVGGWLTAMSVYFAGYLQLLPFILYSLGLLAYLVAMFAMNGHALRESPFRQVAFIFF